MALDVGGDGALGVAFETTLGTFAAPTKWIPIKSESLAVTEDRIERKNLRATKSPTGHVSSWQTVEGEITFEVQSDTILYFLYAARMAIAKTGAGPYTYDFTPAEVATPTTASGATTRKSLSIYVDRGAQLFGYAGCSVTQLAFTVEDGIMVCTASIMGLSESAPSGATPSYSTNVPFGPGDVAFSAAAPAASARTDVDTATLTINDNGEAIMRLNSTNRRPRQILWGERECTASFEADFDALTDYTAFKAATVYEVVLEGRPASASDNVEVRFGNGSITSFENGLSGLGDLIRATHEFKGFKGASVDIFAIQVKSDENIT